MRLARILEQRAGAAGITGAIAALQTEPAVAPVGARTAFALDAGGVPGAACVGADEIAAAGLARGGGARFSRLPATGAAGADAATAIGVATGLARALRATVWLVRTLSFLSLPPGQACISARGDGGRRGA